MIAKEKLDHLIGKFDLSGSGFSEPIRWTDGAGFSYFEKHSDGWVSLYKIGLDESKEHSSLNPLSISVIYGKETGYGVSFRTERKISDPIDLEFEDEFFYDFETEKFFYKRKEVNAEEVLRILRDKHEKPTRSAGGFLLRCKTLFWWVFLPFVAKNLDFILIGLLYVVSGEKIQQTTWQRLLRKSSFEMPDKNITKKFEESTSVDFFGYKARRWSVVFYCCLHLILYLLYFYSTDFPFEKLLRGILGNNFLALCYTVFSFAVTESPVPNLLKKTISELTQKAFNSVSSKKIKV